MEYCSDSEHSDITVVSGDDSHKPEDDQPVFLTQAELNVLTWDLNFSKESTQLLGSHLKEKHLLAPWTTFYWYQDHKRELKQFFMFQDKSLLVYCNNIARLIKSMCLMMLQNEDFLSTHPAKVSKQFFYIMGIVFHLPIEPLVLMKETHSSMDHLLSAVNYQKHKWLICRDLKVVRLILRLQGGQTKYLCFLSLWDSQADEQQYVKQEWPLRQGLKPGSPSH